MDSKLSKLLIVMLLSVFVVNFHNSVYCETSTNDEAIVESQSIQSRKSNADGTENQPQTNVDEEVNQHSSPTEAPHSGEETRAEKDLAIFRKLFLEKRSQHYQAVSSLLETYEYERTYQMIDLLLTRMRTVVGTSRTTLIEKGFEPGMPFPEDEDTKDALAAIMENAGLFGDMVLKLPDITHACLAKKKASVSDILKWAITYSQDVDFMDDLNTKMFHLAAQELGIVPKDPGFINPYRQDFQTPPPPPEKKKKAKAEKKRGPRITKAEL